MFDIWVDGWWLKRDVVEEIAKSMGLMVVPIVNKGTLHHAINWVKNGLTSQWGDFIAEGLVVKPSVDLFSRNGHRLIGKIKDKDFAKGSPHERIRSTAKEIE